MNKKAQEQNVKRHAARWRTASSRYSESVIQRDIGLRSHQGLESHTQDKIKLIFILQFLSNIEGYRLWSQ
jgi:hypothetical protein